MPSKKAKNITNNLCNFCNKICHQKLFKRAQSGHTAVMNYFWMDGQNWTKLSGLTRLLLRNIWVGSTPTQSLSLTDTLLSFQTHRIIRNLPNFVTRGSKARNHFADFICRVPISIITDPCNSWPKRLAKSRKSFRWRGKNCQRKLVDSATILGNLLDFGQLFKSFGNN